MSLAEKIARKIDPIRWALWDRAKVTVTFEMSETEAKRLASLALAREIIAMVRKSDEDRSA